MNKNTPYNIKKSILKTLTRTSFKLSLVSCLFAGAFVFAQSESDKEITEDQVVSTLQESFNGFSLLGKTVMSQNLNKPCELVLTALPKKEISIKTNDSKSSLSQTMVFGDDAQGAKFTLSTSLSQIIIKEDFSDALVKITIEKPTSNMRFFKMETIGAGDDLKSIVCVFEKKK